MCQKHIDEARDKTRTKITETVNKPDGEGGCWLWKGAVQQTGYGYMSSYGLSTNSKPAHWMALFAYSETDFDVLSHGEVHHTCKSPNCVNPSHLVHMKTEFHELLHQFTNPKVALLVCDHLLDAYPNAASEIAALRDALTKASTPTA